MNLPRQLMDMNTFGGGQSFLGECLSFTRPKIALAMEEYRGGGMPGPVKLAVGLQGIEVTHKYGGDMPALNSEFGAAEVDASQLRWVGSYQNQATGELDNVEVVVRGRHEEIDTGDDEVGSKSGTTYKTTCSYYKQVRNGVVEFEIDMLGAVFIVNGVDRWADIRAHTRG
jgi:P2 family phage contractile tail tube protein